MKPRYLESKLSDVAARDEELSLGHGPRIDEGIDGLPFEGIPLRRPQVFAVAVILAGPRFELLACDARYLLEESGRLSAFDVVGADGEDDIVTLPDLIGSEPLRDDEYPVIEGGAYGHHDPSGKKQPEDEGRDGREGDGYASFGPG